MYHPAKNIFKDSEITPEQCKPEKRQMENNCHEVTPNVKEPAFCLRSCERQWTGDYFQRGRVMERDRRGQRHVNKDASNHTWQSHSNNGLKEVLLVYKWSSGQCICGTNKSGLPWKVFALSLLWPDGSVLPPDLCAHLKCSWPSSVLLSASIEGSFPQLPVSAPHSLVCFLKEHLTAAFSELFCKHDLISVLLSLLQTPDLSRIRDLVLDLSALFGIMPNTY